MNLQEIKTAVEEGKPVYWSNTDYVVSKDRNGEFLITYKINGNSIGLTHKDGITLNGKEREFFVAEEEEEWCGCCDVCACCC